MFLWEFDVSPWGSCRFRPTDLLLPEVAFSRGVFLRIQRFPIGKWRVWGAVVGREPRQAQGNNAIHVGAKNMPARPCSLYRNLPHERGPPVEVHEEPRSILQGAPKTWSHARDLGLFSRNRILRAAGE